MGHHAGMRGPLREKGPDLWELRIYLGLDPVTGKNRSLSRTFHGGRRAADRELARLVTEHGGGAAPRRGTSREAAPGRRIDSGSVASGELDEELSGDGGSEVEDLSFAVGSDGGGPGAAVED